MHVTLTSNGMYTVQFTQITHTSCLLMITPRYDGSGPVLATCISQLWTKFDSLVITITFRSQLLIIILCHWMMQKYQSCPTPVM